MQNGPSACVNCKIESVDYSPSTHPPSQDSDCHLMACVECFLNLWQIREGLSPYCPVLQPSKDLPGAQGKETLPFCSNLSCAHLGNYWDAVWLLYNLPKMCEMITRANNFEQSHENEGRRSPIVSWRRPITVTSADKVPLFLKRRRKIPTVNDLPHSLVCVCGESPHEF